MRIKTSDTQTNSTKTINLNKSMVYRYGGQELQFSNRQQQPSHSSKQGFEITRNPLFSGAEFLSML